MLTINPDILSLILTLLIPVATALVTKSHASPKIKGAVALVLSLVVALINGARVDGTGPAVISAHMAWEWAITSAVQLFAYLGVLKPMTDINDRLLPAFGIGKTPRQ